MWKIQELQHLRGFAIEWVEPAQVIFSKRHRLYEGKTIDSIPREIYAFSVPLWRRLVSKTRQGQRLLRFMYYNVLKLSENRIFATFDKSFGLFENSRFSFLDGIKRPTRILRGGVAKTEDGSVFWGEYFSNPAREPVSLYRLPNHSRTAEIAHTFGAGQVRHIHGVYHDPYENSLWCTTGDRPSECRLYKSTDGFRTLELVGAGDETWRAVSLLFSEDSVYYGTDAEFQKNHLYCVDRKSRSRTVLGELSGPVYYSHRMQQDFFFGVAAELCPSQTDRHATLWHLHAQEQKPRCIVSFEKDILPLQFFMPGTIHFPAGPGLPDVLFFSCVGLKEGDDRNFAVSLSNIS